LCNLGIGWPAEVRCAIEKHRAKHERDDAERQLLQHRGGDGGVFAAQA